MAAATAMPFSVGSALSATSAGNVLPSRRRPVSFSPDRSAWASGSAKNRVRSSCMAGRPSSGTSVSTARPMNSPAG